MQVDYDKEHDYEQERQGVPSLIIPVLIRDRNLSPFLTTHSTITTARSELIRTRRCA
jgi:hypothetical protein